MANAINWRCPFCDHSVTITDERRSFDVHYFDKGNKYGLQALHTTVYVCPNPECLEYTLVAYLANSQMDRFGSYEEGESKQTWRLIPSASIRIFPDYVPAPIISDYREACLVGDLSPKAAATLARRCLQGIIRDFWGFSKPRLVDEIEEIREKVDPITWTAIDSVRNIGNIGAHMEKDINLIVDVEPEEARLLIGLIETLITEWYINKHEREKRMTKIISIATEKKDLRNSVILKDATDKEEPEK